MADNKLAPQFAKETDLFKTNEVILSGNFSTGQVYTREPSVFANNIAEELGIESLKGKSIGEEQGDIPIWYSTGNGQGVVMYASNGGIAVNDTNTAFNKNFGTSHTQVAYGDHDHGGFAVKTNNVHMLTNIFTGAESKTYTFLQLGTYANYTLTNTISPAINVSLYGLSGSDYVKIADSSFTVTITTREASTDMISLNNVTIGGLTSSKTYLLTIVFKDDNGFSVSSGT